MSHFIRHDGFDEGRPDLGRYYCGRAVSKKRYQHFKANHSCYFRQAPEISL